MSTSKPLRNRPKTGIKTRADHYRRLAEDAYAGLTPLEKQRHDMHIDIDAVIDATPYAELDRDSIGFPKAASGSDATRGGGCDPGKLNAVEAASQNRHVDTAIDWLTEARGICKSLTQVANLGRFHYGFDPDRGQDDMDRPSRPNRVDTCVFCDDPAPSVRGADGKPSNRKVDDMTVHRSPCYGTAATQALRAGITVAVHLNNVKNLKNHKTAGH